MKKIIYLSVLACTLAIQAQAQSPRKNLIEEFTGTWCPNCPDGHTILKGIETANPGKTIVVGMHNNDQFTIPYEQAMESNFQVAAFPRATIDRVTYSGGNAFVMSRSYWAGAVAARANVTSPVEITLNATRTATDVNVNVSYKFTAAVSEETRLTCVLLEDSIVANQSGGTTNYVHYDVCRALLSGDNWGDANHPTSVASGTTYTKTYSAAIPAAIINKDNLRVVAFINKKVGATPTLSTGTEVLNAEVAKVNWPLSTASATAPVQFNVIPNPVVDLTRIDFYLAKQQQVQAYVTDLRGAVVQTIIDENRSAGNHSVLLAPAAALNNGVYYVTINTAQGRLTKAISLQR